MRLPRRRLRRARGREFSARRLRHERQGVQRHLLARPLLQRHLPRLGGARRGHGAPTRAIEVAEASHPVPDAAGEIAARRILALAAEAGPDDLVVFLMSGGASALLAAPAEGVSLGDKQAIGRALLRSGAPIDEMNRVRQALSAVKGGRLAAVAGARGAACVTWAISDVPGDAPAVIGSGPTVPLPEGEAPEDILARLYVIGAVSPAMGAALVDALDREYARRDAFSFLLYSIRSRFI